MFLLRLLSLSDAAKVAEYYRRNEAFHRPWSPLTPPEFTTTEFQERRLQLCLDRQIRGEQYRFGVFTESEPAPLIATISISAIEPEPFLNGRLGYSVDEAYRNQGIVSKYLQQVVKFAFAELGLHRLEANVMPRNAASKRVLEKCGFEKIGYSPQYLKIQGMWEDHELYMVLAASK